MSERVVIDETLQSVVVEETNTEVVVRTGWPDGAKKGANNDITSLSGITGGIATPDYIDFDTTASSANAVGRVTWDSTDGSLQLGLTGGNAISVLGQTIHAYVKSAESVTINKGQPVYLYQATGNRASVKLAYNTGDSTSATTFGLAAESIAPNQAGFIVCQGVLDGLNTGAYNEGDILYLGATAGTLTSTKPKAPNHMVYVGVVERANNGNGQIYVRVQNGYELDEIHDVLITSPTNGQTIVYNSSTGLWNNAGITSISGVGTMATQNANAVSITGGSISGITDLAVADGGTGASDAPTARTNLGAAASATTITAGTGLTGGGDLSANRTIAIANTAVSAGSYGSATQVGTFTVDAQGRLTAAANTTVTPAFSSITSTPTTLSGYGITDAINVSQKAAANGVATLGADSKIPNNQLPALAITDTFVVASQAAMLALSTAEKGDVAVRTDLNKSFILTADPYSTLGNWQELLTPTDLVLSVNGLTGAVTLGASDVGAAPTTRTISAGTGLSGGGDLSANRTISLADTAVSAASYGSATQVATFTVDAQGRLTAASNTTIAIPNTAVSGLGTMSTQAANNVAITGGSISGITDLAIADGGTGASTASAARVNLLPSYTGNGAKVLALNAGATEVEWIAAGGVGTVTSITAGTGLNGGTITSAGTIDLANTAVTAASYGSATQVATFTVDAQGRLTAASNTNIAIANTAVSGLGTMSTQNSNAVTIQPAASATPANNGDMVFELTDNSTLTIKVKGSDGTVRVVALTLTTSAESFLRLE